MICQMWFTKGSQYYDLMNGQGKKKKKKPD